MLLAQPDHTFKQLDTGIQKPFPLHAPPPPPTLTTAGGSVHLADVDGDGVPDLIQCDDHDPSGAALDPSLAVWTAHLWKPANGGTPAGFDPKGESIDPLATYACTTELYTLDVNGDGKVDLVIGGGPAGQTAYLTYKWVTRREDGTWGAWDTGLDTVPAGGRVVFVDANGDGLPDAVMSGFQDHVLRTFFNTGSFTDTSGNPGPLFTAPVQNALTPGDVPEQDTFFNLAVPLDYNGDGRQDLLVPLAQDTETVPAWTILQAQEAGSNGSTVTPVDPSIPFEPLLSGSGIALADPHGPRVGDLNGDGAPDVILPLSGFFDVFQNRAPGQNLLVAVSDGMNAPDDDAWLDGSRLDSRPSTDARTRASAQTARCSHP